MGGHILSLNHYQYSADQNWTKSVVDKVRQGRFEVNPPARVKLQSDCVSHRRDPGSIDNASLIEQILSNDCVQLKANLRHGIHFEMVPEILWVFLSKYYRSNGPVLSRKVMYRKPFLRPELDLYPVSDRRRRESTRTNSSFAFEADDQNLSESNHFAQNNANDARRNESFAIGLSTVQLRLGHHVR